MYAIAYIAGMLFICLAAYGIILVNRKDKREALVLSVSIFAVAAVLGIARWLFF